MGNLSNMRIVKAITVMSLTWVKSTKLVIPVMQKGPVTWVKSVIKVMFVTW